MALYTNKELATYCGKKPGNVSTAVARGRLVMSGDYIDSSIPENKLVIDKWRVAEGLQVDDVSAPEPVAPDNISDPSRKAPPAPEVEQPKPANNGLTALNKEKTQADIEYKRSKTNEIELKSAKLRGELIPTTMVADVIKVLSHSFQKQYEINTSNILMEVGHKMKISVEIEAELKGKLTELINKAHKKAVSDAKKSINNIISAISSQEMEISDNPDDDVNNNSSEAQ